MANYSVLKAAIADVIKENGDNEITGEILQNSLIALIDCLGAKYQFAGVATTDTNPGTPDYNIAYIASSGSYPNFGAQVDDGYIGIFLYDGNGWDISTIKMVDDASIQTYINDWMIAHPDVTTTVQDYSITGIKLNDAVVNEVDIDFNIDRQLQFADRIYNNIEPDGLGYIILRKNKTLAEQITNHPNTIFEIRYDFNLQNNESITIPINCVLKFNGGSINNGTIILQNTYVDSSLKCFNCNVIGTLKNYRCMAVWFDFITNDFTTGFKRLVGLGNSSGKPLFFNKKSYDIFNNISDTIITVSCDFNYCTINLHTNIEECAIQFSNGVKTDIPNEYYSAIADIVNTGKRYVGIYKNSFIAFTSTELEMRRHLKYQGEYQRHNKYEQFYINDEGYIAQEPFNTDVDVSTIDEMYAITANEPMYVRNLNLHIYDTYNGTVPDGQYRNVGINLFESLNVIVENINFKKIVTIPYGYRFMRFIDCYNLTLQNIITDIPPKAGPGEKDNFSTYALSLGRIIRLRLINVGTQLTQNSWGSMGGNYLTDVYISNCVLNRIDCHYRLNNLTVLDSHLSNPCIAISGYGVINVQRCNFEGRYILRIREDWGSCFDGEITIKDCMLLSDSVISSEIIRGIVSYFDYQCANPARTEYLGARRIVVDNVKLKSNNGYSSIYRIYVERKNDPHSGINPETDEPYYDPNDEGSFPVIESQEDVDTKLDPSRQIRKMPNIIVYDTEINIPMTNKINDKTNAKGTYIFAHTIYDCFVVNPAINMDINIDGFFNKYNNATQSEGVLIYNNNIVSTTDYLALAYKDKGYQINLVGNRINAYNTKIRGSYSYGEEGDINADFSGRVHYDISNSRIIALKVANDSCSWDFDKCYIQTVDNSSEKTTYGLMRFVNCLFDLSSSKLYSWYGYKNGVIFPDNPNITIVTSRITQALADYFGVDNLEYDDRFTLKNNQYYETFVGIKIMNNVVVLWNGKAWIDTSGNNVTYPLTYTISRMKGSNKAQPIANESYHTTLTVTFANYQLPTSITIKQNGVNLVRNTDYTYDSTTGEISIANVTGEIEILGAASSN